jgi:hypothetical protein
MEILLKERHREENMFMWRTSKEEEGHSSVQYDAVSSYDCSKSLPNLYLAIFSLYRRHLVHGLREANPCSHPSNRANLSSFQRLFHPHTRPELHLPPSLFHSCTAASTSRTAGSACRSIAFTCTILMLLCTMNIVTYAFYLSKSYPHYN